MTIDKNNYNKQGLYDKEAVFALDNNALQKCICDAVRENHIDLMLLTDPTYGKRNQLEIITIVSKAIFDNEILRTQVFPDWVFNMEDVIAYIRRNEVQPKLINEYIQLTITSYLQNNNKQNKTYLYDYIANRLSKIIAGRLAEFAVLLRSKDSDLGPESLKVKSKLLEDIEWEPTLSAYIYDYLLTLPCVNLFKQFVTQMGHKDVSKKLVDMIYEAFDYIEIKRERQQVFSNLENIRVTKKKPVDLSHIHDQKKVLEFTALGAHLGQKQADTGSSDVMVDDIKPKPKEIELGTHKEVEKRRQRTPTLQGIGPLDYSVTQLTEEEIFDVRPMEDGKPLAAVIEAGDEDWEEKTIPQRGTIKRNGANTVDSSSGSGEIASESSNVSVPSLPSYTALPPEVEEKVVHAKPEEEIAVPVIPAVFEEDIPEKATITIPELPSISVEIPPKKSINERIAQIRGTIKNNPLAIIAGTLAACTGVLGTYVLTRPAQQAQETSGQKTQLVERVNDAAVSEAMKAVYMPDASIAVMRASVPPEIMQADMDIMAVKPVIAPRIKVDKPAPKQYKPATTVVKKVDLSPALKDIKYLEAVTFASIKKLPEGTYKNMFAGESYVVEKASEGSITGFMQDALMEMARKSPNPKEARKIYNKMLRDLERGWLLYMQKMEEELKGKSNLTEKETQRLTYWNNYKRTHRERGYDAKYLYNKFQKLKEGSGHYNYYKSLLNKGTDLMKGLEELNPEIMDVNSPGSRQIVYARSGGSGKVYVLKTFLDLATGMKMAVPLKDLSTTGELTPANQTAPKTTFAEIQKPANPEAAVDRLIKQLEHNEAEREAKEQAQKDSTMNLLDRIVASVESNAVKSEAEKAVQQEKTDKFLDKMLAQIEENNHQRDLQQRNNWVVGETSKVSSGTIAHVNQPAITSPKGDIIPKVILNDISATEQSGKIFSDSNISRKQSGAIISSEESGRLSKTQSGVIEKPVISSGIIVTSESSDRLSKTTSGTIEQPKKKTFFAGVKEKAKSLWGRMFG